jgi:signal transduction histidine kinase
MTKRLIASYLAIAAFVLVVLVVPLGLNYAARTKDNLYSDIERDARVLATQVESRLESETGPDPSRAARDYGSATGGRAVVVDARGIAVADSDPRQAPARDFSTRPEFAEALQGQLAKGTRPSDTLDAQLIYVAVPVASGGRVLGAVRVTYPRSALDNRVRSYWLRLGALAGSVLLASAVVGWLLARSISRPLRDLQMASARVSHGDLTTRVNTKRGPPEARQLADAFNTMSARVEVMLTRERSFTGDVSHQLRTPLTALRLRLESLELVVHDPDASADIEAAIGEVERLTRLIDALLALARVSEGRVKETVVDASKVVDERIAMWGPLADENGVALIKHSSEPHRVRTTEGALDQILDNLLANALEVSPPGSSIAISVARQDTEIAVTVTDEGPGMPDADFARAFDRFFTTGGTGLGLAIVERLAAASGGRAFLRHGELRGLEVGVRLPSAD